MLIPILKEWSGTAPPWAPQMIILSVGSRVVDVHLDLPFPVLSDTPTELAKVLGFNATPSGLLLDSQGRIVGTAVTGATDLMSLANGIAATAP